MDERFDLPWLMSCKVVPDLAFGPSNNSAAFCIQGTVISKPASLRTMAASRAALVPGEFCNRSAVQSPLDWLAAIAADYALVMS
jgi:hypothetical protein